MTKSLRTMMGMQTNRAKELVKLLDKLVKQDHLFSDEKLKEMKAQLRVVKEELAQMEAKYSKGFGKK
jgi:Holliday junction resolvasome RuvABC ATP-dependent DNA helicase subunit